MREIYLSMTKEQAQDPAALRAYLREYGAWDEEQLADHDRNLQRLVWITAGDMEENNE